jgi:metacaspase-1
MPKGMSVHIGLNRVDPSHYDGWDGELNACENDARDMQKIAEAQGFQSKLLLTAQASSEAVTEALRSASQLRSGDILLVTYSGHGGQVPDKNGDDDDSLDETWVLYDRELIDDELYALWGGLKPGVRVLVLSDSCHSGSVVKTYLRMAESPVRDELQLQGARFRVMPVDKQRDVYNKHKALYDGIQNRTRGSEKEPVAASVLLVSGCQDWQLSLDGAFNGLFTATLLKVWDGGKFKGDYQRLHEKIGALMPPTQTPNYYTVGTPDPRFERERPFSV